MIYPYNRVRNGKWNLKNDILTIVYDKKEKWEKKTYKFKVKYRKKRIKKTQEDEQSQLTLVPEETELEKRLRSIDINKLTPMESMNILFELIKLLNHQ